jgi:hypothetical protein
VKGIPGMHIVSAHQLYPIAEGSKSDFTRHKPGEMVKLGVL